MLILFFSIVRVDTKESWYKAVLLFLIQQVAFWLGYACYTTENRDKICYITF